MSEIPLAYAIGLLVAIALAVGSYRALRSKSRLLAVSLALLVLSSLVLLWPVPIHGGFTFLGEILYRELGQMQRQRARDAEQQETADFIRRVENRTAGPLSFIVTQSLTGGWAQVEIKGVATKGAGNAWHDSASGLLWSDWLALSSHPGMPALADARARCQRHPPAGKWALASETDNYLLWKAGGETLLPPAPSSSIAQLLDPQTRLEMPTYQLKPSADNREQDNNPRRRFVVRCTARGSAAPTAAYSRKDIPLAEWNRFQMRKMLSGNE